jgi:Uncharacterized protein conserved in bacteria
MKIIVDADASPVKNEIIQLAGQYTVPVVLVSSIAHYSFETYPSYVKILYVEKGADRADFKIVQLAEKGDIIVTQDYGLASLLLPKGCRVVHHMGYEYTTKILNVYSKIVTSVHLKKSGERTKGPRPFTEANRQNFIVFFNELLEETSKNK